MADNLQRIDIFDRRPDNWYSDAKWIPLVDTFDEWDDLFFFYLESSDFAPIRIKAVTERLAGLLHDFGFDPMPVWRAYLALSTRLDIPSGDSLPTLHPKTDIQITELYREAQLTYMLVLRAGTSEEKPNPDATPRKKNRGRLTCDAALLQYITNHPEDRGLTARQFATKIPFSFQAIAQTPTWKKLSRFRDENSVVRSKAHWQR